MLMTAHLSQTKSTVCAAQCQRKTTPLQCVSPISSHSLTSWTTVMNCIAMLRSM